MSESSLQKVNISDKQAISFARSFYTAVSSYIVAHEQEYLEWLKDNDGGESK